MSQRTYKAERDKVSLVIYNHIDDFVRNFIIGGIVVHQNYEFDHFEQYNSQAQFREGNNFTWFKLRNTYDAESSTDHSVIQNQPKWFEDFKLNAHSAESVDEIYPLVDGIANLFSEADYSLVEKMLDDPMIDSFSPTALVTLVRTTYPARNKLSNWVQCVDRVSVLLNSKYIDSKKALRGLL